MSINDKGEIIHKELSRGFTAAVKASGINIVKGKEPVVVVKDHLNENYDFEGLEVEIRIRGHLGDAQHILTMWRDAWMHAERRKAEVADAQGAGPPAL